MGCGDDDDDDGSTPAGGGTTATTSGGGGATPAGTATVAATAAAAKTKGGVARFTSANNTYDTFDADRTRFGPMGTLLGLTNNGVVQWSSFAESKIAPYFAESMEQPDQTTFTFKVRKGLTWHNKPPVNGRAANAQDIVFHFERNRIGKLKDGSDDPNFYRKALFQVVSKTEAVDNETVKVTMANPWPFLLNTLADTWTKIQAPEAVDKFETAYAKFASEQIIGTGAFTLSDFKSEGTLSFRRFDKASTTLHEGGPWLDGFDFIPLFTDQAAQQAAFEQKQIDAFTPSQKSVLDDLKKRLEGKVREKVAFGTNPVSGTYYGGTAPWQDQRLIGAIFQIMDRRGLVQQLHQGRGAISGNVPPGWDPFAIPEKELIKFPGYLEDRDKDYADAKAKWAAGGGDKLGEILVDIPDIYEGAYSGVSGVITTHLKSILGNDFKVKLEPYATITAKIVGQKYGNGTNNIWFGWVNPPADPEPSVGFINGYNSTKPNYKQYEVKMPNMDEITNKLAVEFDVKKRIDLCQQAGKELLTYSGGGALPLYLQLTNTLYWNYFKTGESNQFVNAQNYARDLWFDQKDPTFAGRPS
ncbi:hypothetical protein AYO38_06425 [bacterium SCGC AG-212-C10]|nr:hypothetical protein AYO38_06425 [bacterium SCGC AG-212-C10]